MKKGAATEQKQEKDQKNWSELPHNRHVTDDASYPEDSVFTNFLVDLFALFTSTTKTFTFRT